MPQSHDSVVTVSATGCLLALITISVSWAAESADRVSELVDNGIAARYVGDAGIDRDPDVIFASGFEDGIQEPMQIGRKGVVALTDPAIAHSGKACVQITATKNVDQGGDVSLHWDEGVDRCYLRVYVRFDKDTLTPHHFINLRGYTPNYKYRWGGGAGLRPPPGPEGGLSTTLEPPRGADGRWFFYSYWHEMRSWQTLHGAADGRPNAYYGNVFATENSIPLVRDQWICLEFMIKLNDIGQQNGEQAFWVDGKLAGHWKPGSPDGTWVRDKFRTDGDWNTNPKPFEGFEWRTSDLLKVNNAQLQWYLSNNQSWPQMTADKNMVYFDNLVIAKAYIGPMKR